MVTTHLAHFFFIGMAEPSVFREANGFEMGGGVELRTVAGTYGDDTTNPLSGDSSFYVDGSVTACYGESNGYDPSTGEKEAAASSFAAPTTYHHFLFRADTTPATGAEEFFAVLHGSGLIKMHLRLTSADLIAVYDSSNSLVTTGTTAVADGDRIEVHSTTSSSASAYEVKINGSSEVSGTCTQTNNNCWGYRLGWNTNRTTASKKFTYDDYICRTDTWVGTKKCSYVRGDGNSATHTGYTNVGGEASKWEATNQHPYDGTDYVSATANGEKYTSTLESGWNRFVSGAIDTVFQTQYVAGLGFANDISMLLRYSSTDYETGVYTTPTGGIEKLGKFYDTDLSTGSAWATRDLTNIEIGGHMQDADLCGIMDQSLIVVHDDAVAPDRRRIAGWESGKFESWITSGQIDISTSTKHTGERAIRFYPTGSQTGYMETMEWRGNHGYFSPSISNSHIAIYYYLDSTEITGGNREVMGILRTTAAQKISLSLNASNQIQIRNASGTLIGTTGTGLTLDTWQCIEIYCESHASAGQYEIWIDGVSQLKGTTNTNATGLQEIWLGKNANIGSQGYVAFVDDLIVDQSNRVGLHSRVLRAYQDGNGAETDFTANTGTKWEAVDDVTTDDDTTKITASTSGDKYTSTFETAASAGITGEIGGIQVLTVTDDVDLNGPNLSVILRTGGTSYSGSSGTAGDDWAGAQGEMWSINPSDSEQWTLSDIDSIEAGVHLTDNKNFACTQVVLEIEFIDPDYVDEADVSDTFISGHEAHGFISDTHVGGHEAHGYITGTAVGGHEAMQSLSDTFAGAHEALQGISDTFIGAHEVGEQYMSGTMAGAHEAMGFISDTMAGGHEADQGLSDTFIGGHEGAQGASDTFVGAHEVMGFIDLTAVGGHEAMQTVEDTFDGGHEAQQTLEDTFIGGQEAAGKVSDTFAGAHEAHGYISGTASGAHEALQSISDTFAGAHEVVQGVSDTFVGAHETMAFLSDTFQGGHEVVSSDTPVSDTFVGGHEAHGFITDTFGGGHESMQPLEQTFTGEHEALQGVSDQFAGAHEALGFIAKEAIGGHEVMGLISDTFGGGHESMQPVQDTFTGGHEADQFVSDEFAGAHEAEQGAEAVNNTFTGGHEATAAPGEGSVMDMEQIIKWTFDQTSGALRTTNVGATSGDWGSDKDWKQIIKDVYDSSTNKLRVTTVT